MTFFQCSVSRLFLMIGGLIAFLSPTAVEAATCSNLTGSTCQATDLTLATCSEEVCGCKDGGFPIPTGCSKKLSKPKVTLSDTTRISVFLPGANETLICSISLKLNPELTVQWMKDSMLVGNATLNTTYAIKVNNTAEEGLYSCQIKFGDYNASDESDPMHVTLLTYPFKGNLTVINIPKMAAKGANYTPDCQGLPVGVKGTFMVDGHPDTPPFVVKEGGGNLTCSYNRSKSDPVNSPEVTSSIKSVTVNLAGSPPYVFKNGTNVTLACQIEPSETNMNLQGSAINYTFFDGNNEQLGQTYIPDSFGSHVIRCGVSRDNQSAINSTSVTVTFNNSYIAAPELKPKGTYLIEGSQMVMTCDTKEADVTFSWTKDGTAIDLQYDRTIQIDNFTQGHAGIYSCALRKNNYVIAALTGVNITITDHLNKPVIVPTDGDVSFYEGETYQLECRTSSATAGMTYTWELNGTTIPNVNGSTYILTKLAGTTHNLTYTCDVSFNNHTNGSDVMVITVKASVAGHPCSSDSDCSGTGYQGSCSTTKPRRCTCKTGYQPKGTVCQMASSITGSASLIALTYLISRLM